MKLWSKVKLVQNDFTRISYLYDRNKVQLTSNLTFNCYVFQVHANKPIVGLKTEGVLEGQALLAILMLISSYIVTKLIVYVNWDAVIMASQTKHYSLTYRVILHLTQGFNHNQFSGLGLLPARQQFSIRMTIKHIIYHNQI